MATDGETENVTFTGDWQPISAGGNVTHRNPGGEYEWCIKAAGWVPTERFIGHCGCDEDVSAAIPDGKILYVNGAKGDLLVVTADTFALV